jgi:hypothetical protein
MKKLFLLSGIFCVFVNPIFSQKLFMPEVKRVAVFKNGYAFTYREGEAQAANGWAYTTNAPIGVLGTVWGYSTSPNVRMIADARFRNRKKAKSGAFPISPKFCWQTKAHGFVLLTVTTNNLKENIKFSDEIRCFRRDRNRDAPRYVSNDSLTIALKAETGTILFPVGSMRNIEIIGQPKMEKTGF